jgi:hypothetical protein
LILNISRKIPRKALGLRTTTTFMVTSFVQSSSGSARAAPQRQKPPCTTAQPQAMAIAMLTPALQKTQLSANFCRMAAANTRAWSVSFPQNRATSSYSLRGKGVKKTPLPVWEGCNLST